MPAGSAVGRDQFGLNDDAFAPVANPLIRRYLSYASGTLALPSLDYLNEQAARWQIVTGGGLPLRFDLPDQTADYEHRAYYSGTVATRSNNWHDVFNALVWLNFPLSKAALNAGHIAARQGRPSDNTGRGKVRDTLTQFDECGVVVAGASQSLWQSLTDHQWIEIFITRRAALLATTRFIVFGHGSLDALRAPFTGLCGKAVFVPTDPAGLAAIDAGNLAQIDATLARRVISTNSPGESALALQPLPLLGIPGATAENERADFYEDARQFRPRRSPASDG